MKNNILVKILSLTLCITLIQAIPPAKADEDPLSSNKSIGGLTFGGGAFQRSASGSSMQAKPYNAKRTKSDSPMSAIPFSIRGFDSSVLSKSTKTSGNEKLSETETTEKPKTSAALSATVTGGLATLSSKAREASATRSSKAPGASATAPAKESGTKAEKEADGETTETKTPEGTGTTTPTIPESGGSTAPTTPGSGASSFGNSPTTGSTTASNPSMEEYIKRAEQAAPFMKMAAEWQNYLSKIEMQLGQALMMEEYFKDLTKQFSRILSPFNQLINKISVTPGNPNAPAGANLTLEEFKEFESDRKDILDGYADLKNSARVALADAIAALKAEQSNAKNQIEAANKAYEAIMKGEANTTAISSPPAEIPSGIKDALKEAGKSIGIIHAKLQKLRDLARRLIMRVRMTQMSYQFHGIPLNPAQQRVIYYTDELEKKLS